jgi:hypothetical protein
MYMYVYNQIINLKHCYFNIYKHHLRWTQAIFILALFILKNNKDTISNTYNFYILFLLKYLYNIKASYS